MRGYLRGHAFLMSASAHEAAQESDVMGGSYFTHYLLAGLRGAADSDADGVVTLDEAYRFAAHETLLRTIRTMGGPQHPTYDFALTGEQSLPLTDLRTSDSALDLPAALRGHVFVYDSRGRLRVEMHKSHEPVTLALPADDYDVFVSDGDALWTSQVTLRPKQRTAYDVHSAGSISRELALKRGAVAAATTNDLRRSILPKLAIYCGWDLVWGSTTSHRLRREIPLRLCYPVWTLGPPMTTWRLPCTCLVAFVWGAPWEHRQAT